MKKIYLATALLLAFFVTACQKDDGNNNSNRNEVSADGVWQLVKQEESADNGKTWDQVEEPQKLECLKKSTITFQKGVCIFQQYIAFVGNSCRKQNEIKGSYKLTESMLEITSGNSVIKYEVTKKTDKEIIIKQKNESGGETSYIRDTYTKK